MNRVGCVDDVFVCVGSANVISVSDGKSTTRIVHGASERSIETTANNGESFSVAFLFHSLDLYVIHSEFGIL